jgi:anti-sigma factor RsiW
VSDEQRMQESELQAFVDGRLPAERRAQVEAYLAAHPHEAESLSVYRQHKAALHALFDPVMNEEIPSAMSLALTRQSWRQLAGRAAVTALYLLLGAAVGWWLRGVHTQQGQLTALLVERAADAYIVYTPEVVHPVEVKADQEEHLVKWLSKRLGARVSAPDLTQVGYHLVGGRLLPAGTKPAAQFMYENAQGKRVTLYVRRNPGAVENTAFRFAQVGRVHLFYWIDGPLGYALVGELDRNDLLKLANVVYRELNI